MLMFRNFREGKWYRIVSGDLRQNEFPMRHFRAIHANNIQGGCAAVQEYWNLDVHPFFDSEAADDHLCRICDALWEFREGISTVTSSIVDPIHASIMINIFSGTIEAIGVESDEQDERPMKRHKGNSPGSTQKPHMPIMSFGSGGEPISSAREVLPM